MPRYLVRLQQTATQAQVETALVGLNEVSDLSRSRSFNGFIVTAQEGSKNLLAQQPGVAEVFDDIQAVPLVADPDQLQDFLDRVREMEPESERAPLVETEPARSEDQPITDGGTRGGAAVGIPSGSADNAPVEPTGPVSGADDSLAHIGITELHEQGITGEGVICANVDTGVCIDQISEERRLDGVDLMGRDGPWTDFQGHGSYTMGIMAGDENTKGVEVGAAPDSLVFPIKTNFKSSQLVQAQDALLDLADERDEPIIVNNSWGFVACDGFCDHPATEAIDNASQHPQIYQVFAAGNEADFCGQTCDGTSVGMAGPSTLNSTLGVAAGGKDGEPTKLQSYSSRGSAERLLCGEQKPDVTAPIFGQVPWHCGERDIGNVGGTSGACPHVSGAIALALSNAGMVDQQQVFSNVEQTANQFMGDGWSPCSGHGTIDAPALVAATQPMVTGGIARSTFAVVLAGLAAGAIREATREPERR